MSRCVYRYMFRQVCVCVFWFAMYYGTCPSRNLCSCQDPTLPERPLSPFTSYVPRPHQSHCTHIAWIANHVNLFRYRLLIILDCVYWFAHMFSLACGAFKNILDAERLIQCKYKPVAMLIPFFHSSRACGLPETSSLMFFFRYHHYIRCAYWHPTCAVWLVRGGYVWGERREGALGKCRVLART